MLVLDLREEGEGEGGGGVAGVERVEDYVL